MGAWYSNITLKNVTQKVVLDALRRRKAFITNARDGCVVVFDSNPEMADQESLAAEVSMQLACVAFTVLVADDDVFWYRLHDSGLLLDHYNSAPGYLDDEQFHDIGGNAKLLIDTLGASPSVEAVEKILHTPKLSDQACVFETERHTDLIAALELPEWSIGLSYESLEAGQYEGRLSKRDFRSTRPRRATASKELSRKKQEIKKFVELLVRDFIAQGRCATAMCEAVRWGRLDLVKELLAAGLTVNERDEFGVTPLIIAASGGRTKIVQFLIDQGADVNAISQWNNMTPLLAIVAGMQTERTSLPIAGILLNAGADKTILVKDNDGRTALDWVKDGRPQRLVDLIHKHLPRC